jgi:hypothetical protein
MGEQLFGKASTVSQFAEAIEKHSPRQGISSLAFVEAGLNAPTQLPCRSESRG